MVGIEKRNLYRGIECAESPLKSGESEGPLISQIVAPYISFFVRLNGERSTKKSGNVYIRDESYADKLAVINEVAVVALFQKAVVDAHSKKKKRK